MVRTTRFILATPVCHLKVQPLMTAIAAIDNCPYRVLTHENHHETAHCSLLQTITGVARTELLEVSRDACQACCQSFPPTPEAPNAVIASLLYRVAETLLDDKTLSGDERSQAEQLRTLAEKTLPLSYPDEEDVATWPPLFLPQESLEP